jgi:hypothetical protein
MVYRNSLPMPSRNVYCAVNASMNGCIHFSCNIYLRFCCTFRGSKKSFAKWTKIEFHLKSSQNNTNSRLQLTTRKNGVIWLDQVSVMPLDTYMVSCYYSHLLLYSLFSGGHLFLIGWCDICVNLFQLAQLSICYK